MKAIVIPNPNEIEIRDIPMPEVKEGEALLKVKYVGICGADVASFTGNQPFTTYPRIPGHEFSAEIVSIPENDKGLKAGDIVTCNPYFNCGECYSCERGFVNCCTDNQTMGVQRDGAFCEYISMPVERIYDGKGLSAQELALIEPFAISQHAVSRATIKETDNVLVIGAGPIGLFALLAAKQKCKRIVVADILDNRLALAKEYGVGSLANAVSPRPICASLSADKKEIYIDFTDVGAGLIALGHDPQSSVGLSVGGFSVGSYNGSKDTRKPAEATINSKGQVTVIVPEDAEDISYVNYCFSIRVEPELYNGNNLPCPAFSIKVN